VERDGTFWEVYDGRDPRLRPYRGRLGIFRADEAMLWSAILLDLLESRERRRPGRGAHLHSSDADLSELR
jgi:hypothetical protein